MSNHTRDARYFLIVLLLIFLGLTILLLSGFAAPIVIGLVLAGISYGLHGKIKKRLKSPNLSALLMLLILIVIIVVPLIFLSTALFIQAVDLVTATQAKLSGFEYPQVETIEAFLGQYGHSIDSVVDSVTPSIQSLGSYITKQVGRLFSNIVNFALGLFIMLVTIFYFLRDGEKIGKFLIDISPLKTKHEIQLYKTFRKVGGAIFFGNFVSGVIQGILGGIGFAVVGIGAPVLWGTIMAFLALIPLLGPYLVFLPAAAYLGVTKTLTITILFLIYNIVIVSSVDNVVKPKLIGDKVKVHPLLVLLSILGGLKFFGVIGIVYGPLIVTILLTIIHIYQEPADGEHRAT